jgi:hypothetical protein
MRIHSESKKKDPLHAQNSLRPLRKHSEFAANHQKALELNRQHSEIHSESRGNASYTLRTHCESTAENAQNPLTLRESLRIEKEINCERQNPLQIEHISTHTHTHTENPLWHHSESHQVATWNIRKQLGNHSESIIIYYCDTQKEHYSERSESTQNPTQYQLKARELGSAPNPLRNQL